MSGGSYDYIYSRLLDECSGQMFDPEMEEMLKDFAEVLHDLEWWRSYDISEEKYRDTVKKFKDKWFDGKYKAKDLYQKGYRNGIYDYCDSMKKELHHLEDELKHIIVREV